MAADSIGGFRLILYYGSGIRFFLSVTAGRYYGRNVFFQSEKITFGRDNPLVAPDLDNTLQDIGHSVIATGR